ncbi:MAG: hypothetical protein JO353_09255 [Phycisphaerae bacterium]|nr:hypothetical protein [Phycisphaerae bacterium]
MEAEQYRRISRLVDQLCPHGRRSRQQFSDASIVKVYFFTTHNDRAVNWACQPEHWPESLRPFNLPSQATMSRRLRSVGVLQLIDRIMVTLAEKLGEGAVKSIDSKPLRVGCYSRDRDAKRGRAGRGEMARGYKLHTITCGEAFKHFTILPMNENDQVGAAMLLPRLSEEPRGYGYVTADNGYDANPVYLHAAGANHQLIAPPRRANAEVRDTRRNSAERIRSLELCANPLAHCGLGENLGWQLLRERKQIERNLGNAAMDGLFAPPPWVRTPHRVATWVAAKLIQRMMRQLEIKRLRA